jgi:hypothetical protein
MIMGKIEVTSSNSIKVKPRSLRGADASRVVALSTLSRLDGRGCSDFLGNANI